MGIEGVHSDSEGSGSLFVLDALHYPCNDLIGMHTWQYDEQLHFEFSSLRLENEPELAAAVRSLLSEVMRAQSFLTIPGSKAYMLRDDQVPPGIVGQAVQRLAEHNILVRVSSRDAGWASSQWKMTQHGLSTVRAAYKLHSPTTHVQCPQTLLTFTRSPLSVFCSSCFISDRKAGNVARRSVEPGRLSHTNLALTQLKCGG